MCVGKIRHNQINLSLIQKLHTLNGGGVGHLDWHIRKHLVELLEVGHKEIAADGVAGSDVQLSKSQCAGIQKLTLPAGNQIHGRFHVF